MLSSQVSPHLPALFTICFDKESNCVKYVEQNWWSCVNNFNFWSKVRALDRIQYKLEGERSEPKIFITIFPHYNLLIKHFFSIISWTNNFFPQVAEQTIYFPKFANNLFFTKNHSPPPPSGIKWSAPNAYLLVIFQAILIYRNLQISNL